MRATPHHETQVYANIQVRQYPAFVKALQQHGLSMSFPALTERRCALRSRCFYAAVDLSDANFSPGGFRRTDTLLWKQLTTAHFTHNMMATFWLLYVPVMTVLLPELARPASGQKR